METPTPPTHFAPATFSPMQEILVNYEGFRGEAFFANIIDYVPDIVLILNMNRQVVYANKAILRLLPGSTLECVLGKRPGDILNCVHAHEEVGGCGTTPACRYCGAVNAILKSQQGQTAVEECRILVKGPQGEEALDLRVWATPFVHDGEPFTCFVALNIADEKQKLFMERIFLHDILNTASALKGFSDLIVASDGDEKTLQKLTTRIAFLSNRIVGEIKAHRQIIAAENNELVLSLSELNSRDFLKGQYRVFKNPDILAKRNLTMDEDSASVAFTSDETLLSRVVGNMIKNAIEASMPGETVRIGCYVKDDRIVFWVSNPTYMPENIRLQIFQRSFSTKGQGRGLGTYSMKYLTEKYLRGQIAFTSTEREGTTFTATYPLRLT